MATTSADTQPQTHNQALTDRDVQVSIRRRRTRKIVQRVFLYALLILIALNPSILEDDKSYYAYATNANGKNIQVARSSDALSVLTSKKKQALIEKGVRDDLVMMSYYKR